MKRLILLVIFVVSATLSLDAQEFVVPAGESGMWRPEAGYESGAFYALPISESDPTVNDGFRKAVMELRGMLDDQDTEILGVYICGYTSPDGIWQDNLKIARQRMENAARYVMDMTGIPERLIYGDINNEGWDVLASMLENAEMPYKEEALRIIESKSWTERKQYLQLIADGKVWATLRKDIFPKLRGVGFAVFCREIQSQHPEASEVALPADTIYVRDTVFVKDTVYLPSDNDRRNLEVENERPMRMGIKTNILSDALALPMAGIEIQLARSLSLDLEGWFTPYNMFCPDNATRIYGFSPELRLWLDDDAMGKGGFVGIHGTALWYTLRWKDGYLYQNGAQGEYDGDAGNHNPAWNVGLTYGYSFALDKRARWAVELALGVGYGRYSHNVGEWDPEGEYWVIRDFEENSYIGLTKASVNIAYRFPLQKQH